jgi:hypothetical protein
VALNDQGIPYAVKIGAVAEKVNLQKVSTLIVVIAHMQRLVNIGDEMNKEFEGLLFLDSACLGVEQHTPEFFYLAYYASGRETVFSIITGLAYRNVDKMPTTTSRDFSLFICPGRSLRNTHACQQRTNRRPCLRSQSPLRHSGSHAMSYPPPRPSGFWS